MISFLLAAALAADLVLVAVAASRSGFSRTIGPLRIRLHDPSTLLILAAVLGGCLIAAAWRTRARPWALAAAAFAAAACCVALTRAAEKMFPLGDVAVIELYVRDATTGRLLVGPYSRFGWHHPGPLYFYLLAAVYWLAGRTTASLAAGAAFVTTASVALLSWVGARSIGARASAVLLLSVLLYLWRLPELAASVWNPHIVVLPMAALVVAAAAAAGGDVVVFPLVVGLASFVAQTDVALVPVAGAVSLAAFGLAMAASWSERGSVERGRAALKSVNASAWLAAALWLPVVAQELVRSPGNLTLLWRFFVGAHGHGQTAAQAATAWAAMLASPLLPGIRLASGGTFETARTGMSLALAVAELVALGLISALGSRSDRPIGRLASFCLGASLVALWSATRIEDRIMDHEVFWISALGAINLGVVALAAFAALWRLASSPPILRARAGGLAHGTLVGACMAICFAQAGRARQGRLPVTATSSVVERLAGSVRQYLEGKHAAKPLVRIGEDNWGLAAGVLLELDRGGIPFAVEESWMPMFPESFAADGAEDAEIAFGNGDEHAQRMNVPGSVSITSFSSTYLDGMPRRSP